MLSSDRCSPVLVLGAVTALALPFAGCDDAPSDDLTGLPSTDAAREATGESAPPAPGAAAEVFTAKLEPLNAEQSFRPVHGSARAQVKGDRVTIAIQAEGLEPGIPHPQHIHGKMGVGECPDASDDANGDGVVDVVEGVPDYGGILVTLDSDLTDGAGTQVDGLPTAGEDGTIHYRQSASLDAVQAGAEMELNLGQRHIVLHGVDPDTDLDEAQSLGGLPAWLTLPVACGELNAAPASSPAARP